MHLINVEHPKIKPFGVLVGKYTFVDPCGSHYISHANHIGEQHL